MSKASLLLALAASVSCVDACATAYFKIDTAEDAQFGSWSKCTLRAALLNIAHQSSIGTLGLTNPDCPAGQNENVIEFTVPAGKSGYPEIHLDPALGRLKVQGHRILMEGFMLDGDFGTGLIVIDGEDARVTIKNAVLRDGVATTHPDDAGGAILYSRGVGLSLINVRVIDCMSSGFGGGIAIAAPGDLHLERTYIANNVSGFGGGLFYFGGTRAFIVDSTIENNIALQGGGILADDSPLHLEGSSIRFNSAELDGGGLNGGALEARLSEFRGNVAHGRGGAIFGGASVEVQDASFAANRSGTGGGAIVANGELRVTRTGFDTNLTATDGGAVLVGPLAAKRCVSISNSTFVNGQASRGAALWISDVAFSGCGPGMEVVNNTFFKNDGGSQIGLEDADGASTGDIQWVNNLIVGSSLQPAGSANCAGRVERMMTAANGKISNTQFPGTSCDTASAKIPVVDLGLDGVTASVGGVFEQVYVPEAAIAFPGGDPAFCTSDPIAGIDQFGNARTCKQGAVEASPTFELPRDYPPH